MSTFDRSVLPVALIVVAAIGGFLADRAARLRRPDHDRGDFWARAVHRICLFLALPILVSGAAAIFPAYWQTGRHLHFDLTGVFGWTPASCYRIALLFPFAVWTLLLLLGIAEKPGGRDAGRWLAGAIGFENSRLWILVCAVPLAMILVAAFSDLGGGTGAYPATAWGMQVVLFLSLVGVSLSAGDVVSQTVANPSPKPDVSDMRPWPEALAAHGLKLRPVTTWPAGEAMRNVRTAGARNLQERLRLRGAHGVAPQLLEAIDSLLGLGDGDHDRSRLVLAPDDCGQTEVVAMAAELLDQRFHAATLVVTAGDADRLAAELRRWLPHGSRVAEVAATGEIRTDALILVVDAQVLSDRLLPQLKNPLLLKQFGLVVWWQLEAYTGVLAANLWAISRRLHRLLEAMGRHDVHTLAFVRSTRHGNAQLAAFVQHLLPHPLPAKKQSPIDLRSPRTVHLHVLESHQAFFTRDESRDIQESHRHLPLVATKVSVQEHWPTYLEVPVDIASEAAAFLQLQSGDSRLLDALQPDAATAGARVRNIRESEVLALEEILGQGGRAAANGHPHHVGITLPSNPYVSYLLSTLRNDDGGFATSRRLVPATPPSSVLQRHLLLALDELPDTMSGLLKNFMWDRKVIEDTLEGIAREGKLTRTAVRFLDERNELRPEQEYKSLRQPGGERRPLDTVGHSLIDVRDSSASFESDDGVTMRVDPERLTIQAYPHRVFVHRGQRYRIREWSSLDVDRRRWLECDREDVYSSTWRIRNVSVFSIKQTGAAVGVGHQGKLLVRLNASLHYEEEVVGALRLVPHLTNATESKLTTLRLARPIARSFPTRAIVLRFPDQKDRVSLSSLAQTLRHLLPVHLGVEEDAIEVVPLNGVPVQGQQVFGLAIVDLYPGGIGLIDAIGDDSWFLLQLLEWGRDWLTACPCKSDQGCARCLQSPASLAVNSSQPAQRAAALNLLRRVV
ncbi:MAG TPA: Zn-binding domain-containing protein [Thermoanaerobaculia bacterium]|jgi:hypothetical protein|nr:Zn-binding domain-containing protein [Thermoanaerobaculia bacterium]